MASIQMRGKRLVLGIAITTLACAGTEWNAQSQRVTASCDAETVSEDRLTTNDGAEIYIEPMAMAATAAGAVLLAGVPNYIWLPKEQHVTGARDSILGVIIDATGTTELVHAPISPRRIASVRSAARDDRSWFVTFMELETEANALREGSVVRLWYGVLEAGAWTQLDTLPIPPAVNVLTVHASNLAARGDTLAWIVQTEAASGQRSLAVYQKHANIWSFDVLTLPYVSYAEPAFSDESGLVLAVVAGDPYASHPAQGLSLYGRVPEWRLLNRLRSDSVPVHSPSVSSSFEGPMLSWWVAISESGRNRREGRAAMATSLSDDSWIVVDSAIAEGYIGVGEIPGGHLWVSDHVGDRGQRDLRISLRPAGRDVIALKRLINPFTGLIAATLTQPRDVLIAGPLFDPSGQGPVVVTLLLRIRVECSDTRSG